MKKVLFSFVTFLFAAVQVNAQLTDWQKQHNKKIVFYDNWLQNRLNETDADASTEIELGNDFWFRAYFDDNSLPKGKDNRFDIRISCEGVSVTLNEMCVYAKNNFETSKGIFPNYVQIQLPGVDNFWKTKNVFSCAGYSIKGEFDKKTGYGCSSNAFFGESLLRFLLSKIDDKVVADKVLNVKYEMVYRTKGEYLVAGGVYETLAEGTVRLKVPSKEKALISDLYRFPERPGMTDKTLEEKIKTGILTLTSGIVKDIKKIQIVSGAYNIQKNYQGTPENRWLQTRVVYTSVVTGGTFTSLVNVTFLYNGSGYDENVHDAYFQCGNTFVPSFATK